MPPKRPSEGNGAVEGGKRPRREEVEGGRGSTSGGGRNIQAEIEASRARAAALLARNPLLNKATSTNGNSNGPPALDSTTSRSFNTSARSSANSLSNGTSSVASIQERIAEAKRRASELASGYANRAKASPLPAQQQQQRTTDVRPSGIHPLLMDAAQSSGSRATSHHSSATASRHIAVRSASDRFQSAKAEVINPYLTTGSAEDEELAQSARGRARRRQMTFNAPGRHIRAAEEARREAQMEALKRKIEEQARKAGLEELTAEERALRRPKPPDVEWWDQAFLPGQSSYDAVVFAQHIEGEGSPIDIYIQHPIPIPAPSDKIQVAPKGVMLTKKEQKKMRRMRRRAVQEDKQDKIKMGLMPPDPPKVKLSNLMRVLASESVADPTKVEARVRREVAARQEKHEQENLERMLTPEQRRAKAEEKKEKDLAKGLYTLVFKIKHLISPSHKFKVRTNALQNGLTGMALFGKDFAVVFVEGGQKGIKAYRHLMLNRIDWHDPGRPKADDDGFLAELDDKTSAPTTNKNDQDILERVDWGENYCRILFEGPVRDRQVAFGFKARQCEADIDAKQALGPKMASYWDLAKRNDLAAEEEEAEV